MTGHIELLSNLEETKKVPLIEISDVMYDFFGGSFTTGIYAIPQQRTREFYSEVERMRVDFFNPQDIRKSPVGNLRGFILEKRVIVPVSPKIIDCVLKVLADNPDEQ